MAKALKPGAPLILVWNMEDRDTAWVDQLRTAYEQHEAGCVFSFLSLSHVVIKLQLISSASSLSSPQYRLLLWHALFSSPSYSPNFEPPEHTFHTYSVSSTPTSCVDRALSKSYTSVLPAEEKQALADKLRAAIEEGDGMKVLKEAEGDEEKVFEYPYKTEVVVIRRK